LSFFFPGIMGTSACMQEVQHLLEVVAPSDATVLLLGETGTGKELAAQALHLNSLRSQGAFVVVNCAALPETLLESELFGHERGAFTGATHRKDGRFLLAHKGTIFLDEIGEMQLTTQAKILRVLQTKEFEPLGGTRTAKVDVRIIAATNRPLEEMVRVGSFREDLYYRLHVFPITLPPLRERLDDLPLLVEYFLKRYREKYHKRVQSLAPEVLTAFRRFDWPGNIRELENVLERGVILSTSETLTVDNLPPYIQREAHRLWNGDTEPSWSEQEREFIIRTLEKLAKNRQKASEVLEISLEELNYKLRAYGLEH